MNDLIFFCLLFFCSSIAIYLLWFICQYNGQVITYYYNFFLQSILKKSTNSQNKNNFSQQNYHIQFYLIGAMPLAILSIYTAIINNCFHSLYATVGLEIFIITAFLFIPQKNKKQQDFIGKKLIKEHKSIIFYTGLWCLAFAFWATVNHHSSLDYMISNTNPDMWAYVRRFAAFTTSNLDFIGGFDSFTFANNSACAYLLGSPKKFSSFLGSLVIYPFQGSALGIAVFQGMLGGTLFICLFREWFEVQFSPTKQFSAGKLILILWALFAPPVYWLMISAYFSNALFLIIVCLTLRLGQKIALNSQVDPPINLLSFTAIITIVFSFYPAFLPIITFIYNLTILIYLPAGYWRRKEFTQLIIKYGAIILFVSLIFYLRFPSQLGLYEIRKSLNVFSQHGSNFVPLNPWNLLQEKPKPMPIQRDFGWYFNLVVSIPFCLFLGRKLWRKSVETRDNLTRRHLYAGLAGVAIYWGYLLAFIPLEHTYRLMKIAISLVYPLAILGLLPFILWCKNQLLKKPSWLQTIFFVLAVAHTIFHIYKTFDLKPYPAGNFTITNANELSKAEKITIVACQDVHVSQFYERLVGLQLALRYPQLQVNVVKFTDDIENIPQPNKIIYGQTIETTNQQKACSFSL